MKYRSLTATLVVVSGSALLTGSSHAKDLNPDYTFCGAGAVTMVSATKEATLYGAEHRGITHSNVADKTFDNHTYHCAGITKVIGDQRTENGYCKIQSPDGDWYLLEYLNAGTVAAPNASWRVLGGQGKWQGLTGSVSYRITTQGKPITPGSFQYCGDGKGKYTLPD